MFDSTLLTLFTPLGPGRMRFLSMDARETLSQLFEFDVRAHDEDATLAFTELMGKPACVQLAVSALESRYFHGVICAMGMDSADANGATYRLKLRPWLWLLGQRTDTRIFQNLALTDVLKAVFEPFSPDFEFRLQLQYEPMTYCVQYNESDLAFASRLLEREGISYHFEHRADRHVMVLTDSQDARPRCPMRDAFVYRERELGDHLPDEISHWRLLQQIRPGVVTLVDYDFQAPDELRCAVSRSDRAGTPQQLELYSFSGLYGSEAYDLRIADVRLQEAQADAQVVEGSTPGRTVCAGHVLTLSEHPRPDQNTAHLVLSTTILATAPQITSGPAESSFECRFTAMPAAVPYRPARVTPTPSVPGLHSAIVVGPSLQPIHTDEFGRIKVCFHWDRLGSGDEESSCWLRVSQLLAGGTGDFVGLPRVGTEVLVAFMEGNPDHPVVVGSVYNGSSRPALMLPLEKTATTFSNESVFAPPFLGEKNELKFENMYGFERLTLGAARDLYLSAKRDAHTEVGGMETHKVKEDRSSLVKGNSLSEVRKNRFERVDGDAHFILTGDYRMGSGGAMSMSIGTAVNWAVGTGFALSTGNGIDMRAMQNVALEARANAELKASANVTVEAGASITLKAGGSTLVLGPAGISIDGSLVRINSGAGAGSTRGAAKAEPDAPDWPLSLAVREGLLAKIDRVGHKIAGVMRKPKSVASFTKKANSANESLAELAEDTPALAGLSHALDTAMNPVNVVAGTALNATVAVQQATAVPLEQDISLADGVLDPGSLIDKG